MISVVIPVYHEELTINDTLGALATAADGCACEVIVVDGDPGGGTLSLIRDAGAVKIIASPGRAAQMNAGARIAHHDVIVFLHADTKLPGGAFPLIDAALADRAVKGGAFSLAIASGSIMLSFIAFTANVRSRLLRLPL